MDPVSNQPLVVHLQPLQLPTLPHDPDDSGPSASKSPVAAAAVPSSWTDQPPTQAGNARARYAVYYIVYNLLMISKQCLRRLCCMPFSQDKVRWSQARLYKACLSFANSPAPLFRNPSLIFHSLSCLKKDFAPGPPYQEFLPESEKYKLANGICLYDHLPKRRGPDRLPGARVRKKGSKADESGFERVAAVRRRKNDDTDPPFDPPFEPTKSGSSPKLRSRSHAPADTPLSLLIDAANHLEAKNTSTHQPPPRLTSSPGHASPEDVPSWLTGSTGLSPPMSHQRLSTQSYVLIPNATGSDTTIQHEDTRDHHPYRSIPRSMQPHGDRTHILPASDGPNSSLSVSFAEPSISRVSRGRHDSWVHQTHSHTSNGYSPPGTQAISYEYVPSSGAYIQYVPPRSL